MKRTIFTVFALSLGVVGTGCASDFGSVNVGKTQQYVDGDEVFGDRPQNGPFVLAHEGVEGSPYFPSNHPFAPGTAQWHGSNGRLQGVVNSKKIVGIRFALKNSPSTIPVNAGLTFENNYGQTMRVVATDVFESASGPGGVPFDYRVYQIVQEHGNGGQTPLCSGANNWAVAIPGWYDSSATLVQDGSGRITFGCALGTLAKCMHRGYLPKPTSGPSNGGNSNRLMACQRMLRFELSPGIGATLFDTYIDILDNAQISTRETNSSLEAAWTSSGPICLSKLRWASLPIGYAGLPDPRVVSEAKYCDDYVGGMIDSIPPALVAKGVYMLSFSDIQDDALLTWRRLGKDGSKPQHYITTSKGEYAPERITVAPAGADPDIQPYFEGVILLSSGGYGKPVVPLYKYQNGAVSTNPSGNLSKVKIGYIRSSEPLFNGLELSRHLCGRPCATTRYPEELGVPAGTAATVEGFLLGWP